MFLSGENENIIKCHAKQTNVFQNYLKYYIECWVFLDKPSIWNPH